MTANDEWFEIARRNARSVQTTIGWIFWDPRAMKTYEARGIPAPLAYIAGRCAPLAPAGPDAVIAAFASISPAAIRLAFDVVDSRASFGEVWKLRDEAVVAGLHEHAPAIIQPIIEIGPALWEIVDQLPTVGRVFFAAHLSMPRPGDPLLSGWHAINCLREWRGDTHWALVAAAGLTGVEASLIHNAWLRYETDWLPRSRGSSPDEIAIAWASLTDKGLAVDGRVTAEGHVLRQRIEDDTDRLTTLPWRLLGAERSRRFAEEFEPPCAQLLKRVDETAGPLYQPASRIRDAAS